MQTHREKCKSKGVILNIDYGLGKTLMSLAHASMFSWNVLVLCPITVQQHILAEIDKHFGKITCMVAKKWDPIEFQQHQIVVMSFYTLARLKKDEVLSHPFVFQTCIIDELEDAIQKKGVVTAVRDLVSARFYVGLTGARRIDAKMYDMIGCNTSKDVYVFRQSPDFTRLSHMINLNDEQCRRYTQLTTAISKSRGLSKNKLFVELREFLGCAKIDTVIHLLTQMQHMKVLVVSEFLSVLNTVSHILDKHRQNFICFTPQSFKTQQDRDHALHVFETNPKVNIMLADLDLIVFGQDCGYVDVLIIVDLPRDVHLTRQLTGRLRRIGQHAARIQKQHVIELVIQNTLDKVIFGDTHNNDQP